MGALRDIQAWPKAAAPGIDKAIPHATLLAMKEALRAVDLDIERDGSVTYETVELVRSVRAQLRA